MPPSSTSKPKSKRQASPSTAPSSSTSNPEYSRIAEQWKRAQQAKKSEEEEAIRQGLPQGEQRTQMLEQARDEMNARRRKGFEKRWLWTVGFWAWLLVMHAIGIWLFAGGFLLTRLVLEDKSSCGSPPIINDMAKGNIDEGCWHPKSFDRAVIILVDALRYDFTIPEDPKLARSFQNSFPYLYETAVKSPQNAFLRPFIADPPTTTLQRLKGLTTGTLPTFIDAGSNFAGTAIDEDNLLMQLKDNGKKIAHLGDDTWWDLFPGYFEGNISKAYESFNVWDLHSVDNGVIDKIFPLLGTEHKNSWDLLIGHCLGVDHAGHRYGPDHPAMTAKLQQMDGFIRQVTQSIDDDTVLIVMGDHGMDAKGDHGGESDDEVEAALWMYSKRPFFGRTESEFAIPPPTAKVRPVNQIDLVPTIALMLGIPIPYNNLGHPIEEVFAGVKGSDWNNLARVSKMASAGIERYQASYFKARGITPASEAGSPAALWEIALDPSKTGKVSYQAFAKFQEETLQVCKGLWARFDIPRMISGIIVSIIALVVLLLYSSKEADEDLFVIGDPELDYAEKRLELLKGEVVEHPDQYLHKNILSGLWDARVLFVQGALIAVAVYRGQLMDKLVSLVVMIMLTSVVGSLHETGKTLVNLLPNTLWGWMSVVFTVSQSVGFASNSYTIWEDSILLFFITSFGVAAGVSSLRSASLVDRTMGVYHSVVFVILGRLASYSKLCREEQMPYCKSTYYASSTSSTSAPWQLAIPFITFIVLPSLIKSFLTPTRSYEGLAPAWISYVFRGGIFLSAIFWFIDAADNGAWFADSLPEGFLKPTGVYLAQFVLALFFIAGSTAFIWAPPSISVVTAETNNGPKVTIFGYGNVLGARYLFLPLNVLAGCLLLSKPMGFGSLAIMIWQILSLAEIVDLNSLKSETITPIMLALLGNFYFFKTGHQATLSSIQWDSAFIPLFTIRYPWSPLIMVFNTFGAQIVAAICVPLVILWKLGPKQKCTLETITRAMGVFIVFFAVEAVATMSWAGHLRRHLMLYRVFSPRFMLATASLLVLDVFGVLIALLGTRSNTMAISEVFGWAD